jgi:soluble lytic murein transglycosylase
MYRRVIHQRYKRKRFGILLLILTAVIALTWFLGKKTYEYFSRKNTYDPIIREAARKYCIDSCLLKAVIWKESKFKQNAKGSKGEVGLMQVRPSAAAKEWSDVNNIDIPSEGVLFYPRLNIEIGAWYLSCGMRRWEKYEHCEELALSQYNAGPRGMSSWVPSDYKGEVIENIKINSTKRYVTDIMGKYHEYAEQRHAE